MCVCLFKKTCSCNGEKEFGVVNEGNKIYNNVSQLEIENLITVFTQT